MILNENQIKMYDQCIFLLNENKNWKSDINKNNKENFYFYHLVPRDSKMVPGITSLEWQYENDIKAFRKNSSKYRDRLCNGWGIYKDRNPNSLTDEEVIEGIKKFRKDKNGANRIYLFLYPPYKELGPKMKKVLNGKDLYRINLMNKDLQNTIYDIDWGFNFSHTGNKRLNCKDYKNITPEQYYSNYDDNNIPLFAPLNHISIAPKNKFIDEKYLEKIEVPLNLEEVKLL